MGPGGPVSTSSPRRDRAAAPAPLLPARGSASSARSWPLMRLRNLRAARLPKQKRIQEMELVLRGEEGRGAAGGEGKQEEGSKGERRGGSEGLVSKPNSSSLPAEQISSVYFISLA